MFEKYVFFLEYQIKGKFLKNKLFEWNKFFRKPAIGMTENYLTWVVFSIFFLLRREK